MADAADVLDVLTHDEALDYWDRRHQVRGELLSGGHLGFDHATNEIFYALRLGRLIDIIGTHSEQTACLRVLDAGCGKGYYTRWMTRFGHRATGVDASPHAVAECRALAAGGDTYACATLASYAPADLFDVVLSVDVLFHIMQDEVWADSVVNLAGLTRYAGLLVLADHGDEHDRVWGDYQKTRAVSSYDELLTPIGLERRSFVPYNFRDSRVGFHVFQRVT